MFFCRVFFLTLLFSGILHTKVSAQTGTLPIDPLTTIPKQEYQDESKSPGRRIEIIHAEYLEQETDPASDLVKRKLIDRVRLRHEGAYMVCDSAILFPQRNYLEAFGRIRITKGDSVDIRSNFLTYHGDTKLAVLEKNVELRDRKSILRAPKMTYEIDKDIGHFWDHGELTSDSTVLTSKSGTYYQKEGYTIFRDNVILKSPDYIMYADSMKYDSEAKIVNFITETTIISDKDTIYTKDGYYDTEKNIAVLKGRPLIKNGVHNSLQSDILDYDKGKGTGLATGNVISRNSKEDITLLANQVLYIDSVQYTKATNNPLLIKYEKKDTLYISADTLINYTIPVAKAQTTDSLTVSHEDSCHKHLTVLYCLMDKKNLSLSVFQNPILFEIILTGISSGDSIVKDEETDIADSVKTEPKSGDSTLYSIQTNADSISTETDSVKIFNGYPNVKMIRGGLSGICDSLYFSGTDSIFRLYYNPVLWMDSTQLKADSIYIFMKNDNAEKIILYNNAIIINEDTNGVFNQISGKEIIGWLNEGKLREVSVDAQAESIYFLKNDSNQYLGGNHAIGAKIFIHFNEDNKISRIKIINSPEATFTPVQLIDFTSFRLPGFSWFWSYRPKDKWDVIRDSVQYRNYLVEYHKEPDTTDSLLHHIIQTDSTDSKEQTEIEQNEILVLPVKENNSPDQNTLPPADTDTILSPDKKSGKKRKKRK